MRPRSVLAYTEVGEGDHLCTDRQRHYGLDGILETLLSLILSDSIGAR